MKEVPRGSICHCGTLHDAFDIAEKLLVDAVGEGICPSWPMQVATAHALMARALFRECMKGYSPEEVKKLVVVFADTMRPMVEERMEQLKQKEEIATLLAAMELVTEIYNEEG